MKSKVNTLRALSHYAMKRLSAEKFEHTVFIGGPAHSGTSIITRIVSSHKDFFCPDNELEIYRGKRLNHIIRFAKLSWNAQLSAKTKTLEKSPANILYCNTLRRVAPSCKFIFIIRDFRDVVASQKKRFQGEIAKPIQNWQQSAEVFHNECGAADVHQIRYEDFVENPKSTIRGILKFLHCDFEVNILDFHQREVNWFGQSNVRKGSGVGLNEHRALRNWQVNQPIFDGRGRWREGLTEDEKAYLKDHPISDLAKQFGYEW